MRVRKYIYMKEKRKKLRMCVSPREKDVRGGSEV